LVKSQQMTTDNVPAVQRMISELTIPATRKWISGRAATTLAQYFTSPMPDAIMAEIAKDWAEELQDYPEWALQKAFRWWTGRGNQKRRQKPVPGDISERAHIELSIVRAAEIEARNARTVSRRDDEPPTERVRPEVAQAIVAEAFGSQALPTIDKRMPREAAE